MISHRLSDSANKQQTKKRKCDRQVKFHKDMEETLTRAEKCKMLACRLPSSEAWSRKEPMIVIMSLFRELISAFVRKISLQACGILAIPATSILSYKHTTICQALHRRYYSSKSRKYRMISKKEKEAKQPNKKKDQKKKTEL